jgi:methyl-accepting chemotaxis protein
MKQQIGKLAKVKSLTSHNARNQAMIAILLIMVVPSLSMFYVGMTYDKGQLTFSVLALILVLTILVARLGYVILRKYPENIMRIRQYITEIAEGALPEKIALTDTMGSDDIKYIEQNFNDVLKEMRRQLEATKEQLRTEHMLRETVEKQQQTLLEAERHRVMIQTLGAACHHIGQPATVLQVRLSLLQKTATNPRELEEIEGCVESVQRISDILHQLQRISMFRTIPYIHIEGLVDDEILAIGSEK